VKQLTEEQVAERKDKAERFASNVLEDDELADEIADETIEDYADRRHFEIINPRDRRNSTMASKREKELLDRIAELEDENDDLNDRLDSISDLVGTDEDADDDDYSDDGSDYSGN